MAILIACACFLLFPLKLVFPRPEVDGFFGLLFTVLRSFDQPHNLAPSLHIALRTLIWPIFIPRTVGLLNLALRGWFFLIGASTVLVYQHQVMDVVTGWILAICCLHLIAERNPLADSTLMVRNARVGMYYAIGGLLLAAATWLLWPWGALLLWPLTAVLVVVAGYCCLGAVIYRKHSGRLAFSTRVLMAPVLWGQYVSWKFYRRQCRAWDEVVPGLWIGAKLTGSEADQAIADGVTAVVDLAAEFSETPQLMKLEYLDMPVLDLTAPTQTQLRTAVEFITAQRPRGTVLVHCKIGYSRSAAVVGAYLLASGRATTADEAIAQLRAARPSIVIRPEARQAIAAFAHSLSQPVVVPA